MGICNAIGGSGLGGAIGKAASALGGALGAAAFADAVSRAITGNGLIDNLSVPYIECAEDNHYASALEWWGNGMKCGKPPDPPSPPGSSHSPGGGSPKGSKQANALKDYKNSLPPGSVMEIAIGVQRFQSFVNGAWQPSGKRQPGSPPIGPIRTLKDNYGNSVNFREVTLGGEGLDETNSSGFIDVVAGTQQKINPNFPYPDPANFDRIITDVAFSHGGYTGDYEQWNNNLLDQLSKGWGLLGVLVTLPPGKNAPRFNGGGSPPEPSKNDKKDCEKMECKCLTAADIEAAVKRALGLGKPLLPETLINTIGSAMYGGVQGRSSYSYTPPDLVSAMASLVATVYYRAGMHRFPAVMPGSLLDDGKSNLKVEKVEEWGQWFEWFIKQFDALMGEFPIDIQIKDKDGSKPLKFENLAECLSELTGLIVQTAVDADTGVNVASRAVVEASKAGNAAIRAQYKAQALLEFLGVRTEEQELAVQSTITPGKLDQANNQNDGHGIREFLQPSVQYVNITKEIDPLDFQAVLQRVLQNSEIARTALYREFNPDKPGKNEFTGDYIRRQKAYDKTASNGEGFLTLKKQIEARYNKTGTGVKIEIDRVGGTSGVGDVVGDGFVIKRPKKPDSATQ